MSYRDRNRKQITLPSGATTVVRKLTAMDSAVLRARGTDPGKAGAEAWTIHALTECCGDIVAGTERFQIVNKSWRDVRDGEIALTELDQADALAIVDAVNELNNPGKEAAPDAKTFPAEEQNTTDQRASNGEALRAASVNSPAVAVR